MQNWILPAVAIGALLFMRSKQAVKKAVEKISVSLDKIKLGFPLKITLNIFNPTDLKTTITYITGDIRYKGNKVATYSKTESQVITPGNNKIEIELKPSLEALALLKKTPNAPKTISVTWEVGTNFYNISGEKSTTL
jgi:long-subunit fatty acid transport protein